MSDWLLGIAAIAIGVLLAILSASSFGAFEKASLFSGSGLGSQACVASSTAWTIGLNTQDGTKTVLPPRANRAFFTLSHTGGVNTTAFYILGAGTPSISSALPIVGTTTITFSETTPYKGAVTANALATTTLIATECIYN